MQVYYNLKYRKSNFSNRVLIEKEGEIIIYDKGFRLRGKGAADKGEVISFSDIKEFFYNNDQLFFITFAKAKYTLCNAGTVFDEFLRTIYKVRNEFLIDALFMKQGKLKCEFEGSFERLSKFSKPINKGRCKLRLYEGSLVIIPENQDAFGINFNFVNFHEFVEDEYLLKITMDDGTVVTISQLGNDYELFQESVENLIGGMYEKIVNEDLKEIFYEFDAGTLLKFAYKSRGGKAVSLKDIQKIDKELAVKVNEFFFDDKIFAEKCEVFDDLADEYNRFFGVARDPLTRKEFIRWIMYSIPSCNVVCFSILPRFLPIDNSKASSETVVSSARKTHDIHFFKIIMEKGMPSSKVGDKVLEIEQSLVNLHFAKDPCYKDKRELKNSPYKYGIRKLPYLRILRKSYVGTASSIEPKEWQKQVKDFLEKSKV